MEGLGDSLIRQPPDACLKRSGDRIEQIDIGPTPLFLLRHQSHPVGRDVAINEASDFTRSVQRELSVVWSYGEEQVARVAVADAVNLDLLARLNEEDFIDRLKNELDDSGALVLQR